MLAIVLGQLLSVFIASTGVFSTQLVDQGISLPAAQSLLNYIALAVVYGIVLVVRKQRLQASSYKFALLAGIDVTANFLLVEAYNYTSLTSVTLLDCWTVPSVLFLSWYFLGARYRSGHFLGAAICVAAVAFLILTDEEFGGKSEAHSILFGDGLVLVGASLYAVSNVMQEKILVDVGSIEVLAMLGLFGAIWSSLLTGILEGSQILSIHWDLKAILPFAGFSVALFAFSSVVPLVLLWGGATILNLSLLSSDIWSALARQVLFGGFSKASAISFSVAFILVCVGIVVFSWSGYDYEPITTRDQQSILKTISSNRWAPGDKVASEELQGLSRSANGFEEDPLVVTRSVTDAQRQQSDIELDLHTTRSE